MQNIHILMIVKVGILFLKWHIHPGVSAPNYLLRSIPYII